jgi:hypothetical protein
VSLIAGKSELCQIPLICSELENSSVACGEKDFEKSMGNLIILHTFLAHIVSIVYMLPLLQGSKLYQDMS